MSSQKTNGQEQPRRMTPLQMAMFKLAEGDAVITLKDQPPLAAAVRGKVLAMQDGILIVQLAADGRIKLINRDAWATIEQSALQTAAAMPVPRAAIVQ